MLWLVPALLACRSPDADPPRDPGTDTPTESPVDSGPSTTSPTDSTPLPTASTGRDSTPLPVASSPYVTDAPPPTNVLLLSIDTLRADHIGSNGEPEGVATPNLDGLLARGLALRTHRSCSSWTLPSFTCIYTGRDQVTEGFFPNNRAITSYPNDELVSLATRFAAAGYATRQVSGNSLIGTKYNLGQGFEVLVRTTASVQTASRSIAELEDLTASDQPWFLQVHFMTPHTAYAPEERFLEGDTACSTHDLTTKAGFRTWHRQREWLLTPDPGCDAHLAELYDALVREVDHYVGEVLAALEASGAADDTVVLFVTDHGEAFDEHGDWEHGFANYDTLTRSTAGLIAPGRIEVAEHTGVTSHEDLAPTLLEALGWAVPEEMVGHPVGTVDEAASFQLTFHADETVQTVSDARGRLHYWWDGRFAYHDLSTDPDELVDTEVAGEPHVEALWTLLVPRIQALAAEVEDEGLAPQGIDLRLSRGTGPGPGGLP